MDEMATNYVYAAFRLCAVGHGMPVPVDSLIDTLDMAGLFSGYQDNLGESLPDGELAFIDLTHNYGTARVCIRDDAVMYVVGR